MKVTIPKSITRNLRISQNSELGSKPGCQLFEVLPLNVTIALPRIAEIFRGKALEVLVDNFVDEETTVQLRF